MQKREFVSLYNLLQKGLNNKTRHELLSHRYKSIARALKAIKVKIENTRIANRKIRSERRETMLKVMEYLLTKLYKYVTGQVNPSLRNIAYNINKELKRPSSKDDMYEAAIKERAIHAEEMKVQRALKTLEEIDIIKIHKYWKNKEHFNSIIKDACNFYQIMPFSNYSSDFKLTYEKELILIEKDKIDMKKLKAKREQAKKAKSSNSLLELIENSKKIFEKQKELFYANKNTQTSVQSQTVHLEPKKNSQPSLSVYYLQYLEEAKSCPIIYNDELKKISIENKIKYNLMPILIKKDAPEDPELISKLMKLYRKFHCRN